MDKTCKWKKSMFNAYKKVDDSLVLYNSYTGAVLSVSSESDQAAVRDALKHGFSGQPTGVLKELADAGMFVSEDVDEMLRARLVHEVDAHATDTLHLVVMPTEQCNFRCVYCYETFPRGEMEIGVREGLKKYVAKRSRRVDQMLVSWFGGEPLSAPEVMRDLSLSFMKSCADHDVKYIANISTNGYLLTPELIPEVLSWQIRAFQITLDGTAETHDQQRKLVGGQQTFERIFRNMMALAARDEEFLVFVRINYNSAVLQKTPELLDMLSERLAGDERFTLWPRPVMNWGGPNVGNFETCTKGPAWGIMEEGLKKGLRSARGLLNRMRPHGSVCYAAHPYSLVVGANGQLYKCTEALYDERNHVGHLYEDGRVELDRDRFALWVMQDEQMDEGCQKCFFRPSCQGNACPLERMRSGNNPCPHYKTDMGDTLRIIAKEAELIAPDRRSRG